MVSLISLAVVLVISTLIVRVASVALTLTGLSQDLARFQARSAFTGSGFTTGESEEVVGHPVRRRIIMLLMLLGNAGLVTVASTLIISLTGVGSEQDVLSLPLRIGLILAGLVVFWLIAQSSWLDRQMTKVISRALKRWTDIELRDYAALLHLMGDYVVVEMLVEEGDWLAGRQLQELRLNQEGVLVLGVESPGGAYVGAPRGQTEITAGSTLLLYGQQSALTALDERKKGFGGNWEHVRAVEEQLRKENNPASP